MEKEFKKLGICSPSQFDLETEYKINFFCGSCLENKPHIVWPKSINNMVPLAPALYFDKACINCNNIQLTTMGKQKFTHIDINHEILLEEFHELIK